MRKWIAWSLTLVCILALAGCTDAGEGTNGSGEPETAAADVGEVQAKGALVIAARVEQSASDAAAALTQEDAAVIIDLLEQADWNTEGTADCIHDCILTVNGELLYYSSDCGAFNDDANQRCLPLSEEQRAAVNTVLKKYIALGLDIIEEKWGVTLSAENVSPAGLTLVCTQSGGTLAGELWMNSRYWLESYGNGAWEAVPWSTDCVAWADEAWSIPVNGSVEWEIDWTSLYGELSAGTYRIGKEIMVLGESGYVWQNCYAEFVLT